MTLVSALQYKVYADIRGGFPGDGRQTSGVTENGNFQYVRSLFLQKL